MNKEIELNVITSELLTNCKLESVLIETNIVHKGINNIYLTEVRFYINDNQYIICFKTKQKHFENIPLLKMNIKYYLSTELSKLLLGF